LITRSAPASSKIRGALHAAVIAEHVAVDCVVPAELFFRYVDEGEFLLGDHGLIRKQIGCKNDKLFIIYQFQVFYGASESSIDVVSGC